MAIYIGTSGWVYSDWEGIFYPQELSSKDRLKYFSQHFKTVEVNYSFYRLPRPSTYQNWYEQTAEDFLFSVKASRFITHIKRLKGVRPAWQTFLKNALELKEKLGPVLFQFPPNFEATKENIKRLEHFLNIISERKLRFAFEFRDKTWCQDRVYNILKNYNAAWVIAYSSKYPKEEVITANFIYIRMHGPENLFSSKYTNKDLKNLAQKIKKWKRGKDIFVYFNNDASGYAIENAKTLKELLV